MNTTSVVIVKEWIDAVNNQDAERITELSDSNMEFTGTRGSGHGIDLVRDWLLRVGLMLDSKRTFARDNAVVVEAHGVWRSVETGEFIGDADEGWRFEVEDGRVVVVERFDDLNDALTVAGLQESDEIDR